MLPASRRMRTGTDFEAAVRRGRRAASPRVVVHVATRTAGTEGSPAAGIEEPIRPVADGPRVGFVVSRAVGNSVVRHRVVRRLRETVRPHLAGIPADRLVVVRAQPPAASATFADLADDVTRLLRRLDAVGTVGTEPSPAASSARVPSAVPPSRTEP